MGECTADVPFGVLARPVVIFDFDGTLADTGRAVIRVVEATLRVHGYDPEAMGDLRRFIGPPLVDGFRLVCGVTAEEAEPLIATYRSIFAREVGPKDYPPLPGMVELVEVLRAHGVRTAVATSRLETSVHDMLANLPFAPFDAVAGRLEPGRSTKADCIRAVLEMLGYTAADAVMVGDRHHDVDGAHELGLPCIGIYRDEDARAELEAAGADALCPSAAAAARFLGVVLR